MLSACVAEEIPEPVLPEEPVSSEPEEISEAVTEEIIDFDELRSLCEYPGLNPTPSDFEGGNPYKAKEVSVPEEIEKLIYRMGRVGEFEFIKEIPNEYIVYSALRSIDMADAYGNEKLAPISEEVENTCFYPKEWVSKAAKEIFGEDFDKAHEWMKTKIGKK